MASFAFTDATIWVDRLNFTAFSNAVRLDLAAAELDSTVFGATYVARKGGLKTIGSEIGGFWESATAAAPDPRVFADLGTADRVWTLAPTSTATSTAYMFQAGHFDYKAFGPIGELTPFTATAMGTNGVGIVRGQVASAEANVSATGALGSAVNLGAVGASQFLYATFHVFNAGTTITILVESDTASNFPSPTTVATIGPLTNPGGTWMTRVAGAITDTWYRFNVSAVTGAFTVAGAIGIG